MTHKNKKMENKFFTYEILDKEIKIIEESKESNDSFNTINEIIKQLRLEGYNQEIIFNGEIVKEEKIFVRLDYYEPLNKFTESGYYDTRSVIKRQEIIEGENNFEIFEKFYKLNNRLRYCNGSYYKFNSMDWQEKFYNWKKSDDYKKKSFNLFYGEGVVD